MDKWRVTRDGMIEKIGLNFSASYHQLGLASLGDDDQDTGFGGDFTLNGLWHFGGKNWDIPFELNFRIRHRHAFGDTAPSGVASQTGALWGLVDGFSDKGLEIPDFFFVQKFPQHGIELRYGQMVIDSQFDRHALRSSKQAFLNRAFSSNPAVAFPRFGVGITVERQCSGGIDYALGFSSVQGTQAGTQVDLDLGSDSYFTAGQVGWDFKIRDDPARLQVMAWHSDAVEDVGLPRGYGVSLVFERAFPTRQTRIFTRAAWADGAAADLNLLLASGVAVDLRENDLFGVALGLGRDSAGTDDVQGVLEGFYRWQIGPTMHLTPSMQVVFGDSLGGNDVMMVAGLRGKLAF